MAVRYLITGGSGFIGSHLADALLAAHAGIRIQGERSREAITALTAAYPKIPVWALPRREPPPNSLPELRELGEQFVKVAG